MFKVMRRMAIKSGGINFDWRYFEQCEHDWKYTGELTVHQICELDRLVEKCSIELATDHHMVECNKRD